MTEYARLERTKRAGEVSSTTYLGTEIELYESRDVETTVRGWRCL